MAIIDLFCGAGGVAAGLHAAGVDPADTYGIEWNADAAATHQAAGFPTLVGDVAALDPTDVAPAGADGLWASPPCQAFSQAGHGRGRDAITDLVAAVMDCRDGYVRPADAICTDDERADLTLEPLRWTAALNPRWVVCEQVPPTLPVWRAMAKVLRWWGYSTWSGVLRAEEYGVPQTRKRALLVARLDGPAGPPDPTHTRYDGDRPDGGRQPTASLFGELVPWVSMGDALGWSDGVELNPGLTASQPNRRLYQLTEPAPTIAFGHDAYQWRWQRPDSEPVRVSVGDAAVLQSFPTWWPWQGSVTSQYLQVGNAVPPQLAAAVVRPLLA